MIIFDSNQRLKDPYGKAKEEVAYIATPNIANRDY